MRRKACRAVHSVSLFCLVALLPFAPVEAALADLFAGLDWISFAPTNFDPTRSLYLNEASLREDLMVLCAFGFHGIFTYDLYSGSGLDNLLLPFPAHARFSCFPGCACHSI